MSPDWRGGQTHLGEERTDLREEGRVGRMKKERETKGEGKRGNKEGGRGMEGVNNIKKERKEVTRTRLLCATVYWENFEEENFREMG